MQKEEGMTMTTATKDLTTKVLRKDFQRKATIETIIVTGSQDDEICDFTKNFNIYFCIKIDKKVIEAVTRFLQKMLVDLHLSWDKLDYIFPDLDIFSELVFERKKIDEDDNYIIIYIYPKNIKLL